MLIWTAIALAACGEPFESEQEDACPGDPSVPCFEDPWNCGDMQTCWFSLDGSRMECLNEGPGALGTACSPTPGNPPCAEGLMCVRLQGETSGLCRQFCLGSDPCKACPAGTQCQAIGLSQAGIDGVTNVCL